MILRSLVLGPFASNCYIVGSEPTKQGMIIDPGDEAEVILREVGKLGLSIALIVVTHCHLDHIGALRRVKEATKAPLAAHTDEVKSSRQGGRFLESLFGLSYDPPPPPDRLLKDGDTIDIGDLHFTVLHTPGHSPGGVCLVGQGVVFSGDTLFNCGIGRTDFPGGSYDTLINSIQTKLMVLPDETIVLSGHGPETTISAERHWNPFLGS